MDKIITNTFPLGFNDNIYHEGNISKMPDFDVFSLLEIRKRKSRSHGIRKKGNGKRKQRCKEIKYFTFARRWVGRQTQWWPRHKAIYFSWFGPELFCLLLGPPGFNCWFSSAPVFQWCCSTPQGSPGVGRNTFLSSPHLCFIIVFICDLFVSRDDPLMS